MNNVYDDCDDIYDFCLSTSKEQEQQQPAVIVEKKQPSYSALMKKIEEDAKQGISYSSVKK